MHNPASNAAAKPCNKASKLMQHNYAPMLHKFLQGWLRAQTNQVICTNEQSCFIAATNPVPRLPKRIQQKLWPHAHCEAPQALCKDGWVQKQKVHIISKTTYPIAAKASTFALPAFTPPVSHMEADVIVSCRECKRANMDCILTALLGQGVISGSFVGKSRVFLIRNWVAESEQSDLAHHQVSHFLMKFFLFSVHHKITHRDTSRTHLPPPSPCTMFTQLNLFADTQTPLFRNFSTPFDTSFVL